MRMHAIHSSRGLRGLAFGAGLALLPALAAAQTPAAADQPSIKVGATIFADYTFQQTPTTTDSAGNTIHSNSFNVSRTYINITGNVSKNLAFRITPDITKETPIRAWPAATCSGSSTGSPSSTSTTG